MSADTALCHSYLPGQQTPLCWSFSCLQALWANPAAAKSTLPAASPHLARAQSKHGLMGWSASFLSASLVVLTTDTTCSSYSPVIPSHCWPLQTSPVLPHLCLLCFSPTYNPSFSAFLCWKKHISSHFILPGRDLGVSLLQSQSIIRRIRGVWCRQRQHNHKHMVRICSLLGGVPKSVAARSQEGIRGSSYSKYSLILQVSVTDHSQRELCWPNHSSSELRAKAGAGLGFRNKSQSTWSSNSRARCSQSFPNKATLP